MYVFYLFSGSIICGRYVVGCLIGTEAACWLEGFFPALQAISGVLQTQVMILLPLLLMTILAHVTSRWMNL